MSGGGRNWSAGPDVPGVDWCGAAARAATADRQMIEPGVSMAEHSSQQASLSQQEN